MSGADVHVIAVYFIGPGILLSRELGRHRRRNGKTECFLWR